jgi:ribosomal protein RSM22 (predicted rRNA methylase)
LANELPAWISNALAARLQGVSRKDLAARAQAMSETYRGGGTSAGIGELDALAYASARMPATYAAARAALARSAELAEAFAPVSLLDIGAGSGTATWAAFDLWLSLQRGALLDRNPALLDLARDLSAAEDAPGAAFDFKLAALETGLASATAADLVTASYALTELALPAALQTVSELWRLTGEMLVIVEPGTPDGFARILAYRNALIDAGANILAPCTHVAACPLEEDGVRWCHFSQRLARSRDHLMLKDASVPYEDEKYSYLCAAKTLKRPSGVRRVLATPDVNKARVALTLCAPGEVEERIVTRREGEAYKEAKRADWGDAIA